MQAKCAVLPLYAAALGGIILLFKHGIIQHNRRRFENTFYRYCILAASLPSVRAYWRNRTADRSGYGKSIVTFPSDNQPLTKAYESSGMNIIVMYIDGVSQREIFLRRL